MRKRLGGRRRCQALWLRMSCNSLVCGSSPSPRARRSPSPVYEAVILPNGQPPERGSVAASAPLVRAAAALPLRRSPYAASHSRSRCDSPLGRQPPPPQPTHPGGRINLDTVTCYKVRQRFALFECSQNRQIRTDFMMDACMRTLAVLGEGPLCEPLSEPRRDTAPAPSFTVTPSRLYSAL